MLASGGNSEGVKDFKVKLWLAYDEISKAWRWCSTVKVPDGVNQKRTTIHFASRAFPSRTRVVELSQALDEIFSLMECKLGAKLEPKDFWINGE